MLSENDAFQNIIFFGDRYHSSWDEQDSLLYLLLYCPSAECLPHRVINQCNLFDADYYGNAL